MTEWSFVSFPYIPSKASVLRAVQHPCKQNIHTLCLFTCFSGLCFYAVALKFQTGESLSGSSAHLVVPLSPLGSWMRKYNQKSANAGSVSSTNTFKIYICFILHIRNLCKKSDKQWKLNTKLSKDHFIFSGGNISNCNSLGVEVDCFIYIYI